MTSVFSVESEIVTDTFFGRHIMDSPHLLIFPVFMQILSVQSELSTYIQPLCTVKNILSAPFTLKCSDSFERGITAAVFPLMLMIADLPLLPFLRKIMSRHSRITIIIILVNKNSG